MWPAGYWALSYWAPTYWLKKGPAHALVTIDGAVVSVRYGTLQIDDGIEERSTASFEVVDEASALKFKKGQPVEIRDPLDGTLIFSGVIENAEEWRPRGSSALFHAVSCADYHYIADKRVAARTYEDATAGFIVKDLWSRFLFEEAVELVAETEGTASVADLRMDIPVGIARSGNFLYVATEGGGTGRLTVIDITNRKKPIVAGSVAHADLSGPRSVAAEGTFAYVSGAVNGKVCVVDCANPGAPVFAGSVSVAGGWHMEKKAGGHLYVACSEAANVRLAVVDVSDPAAPFIAGNGVHAGTTSPRGLALYTNYALVTATGTNNVCVFDVTDPINPTQVGNLVDATKLGGASAIRVSGTHAFVTALDSSALTVISLANPVVPTIAGHLADASAIRVPNDLRVAGGYAYIATEKSSNPSCGAVVVVDVATPGNPFLVTTIETRSGKTRWTPGRNAAIASADNAEFLYVTDQYDSVFAIYAPASTVEAGPTIDETILNYVPVSGAIDELVRLAGFWWNIDENRRLFFGSRSAKPAPWNPTNADIRWSPDAKVAHQNPRYRNRQWVRGVRDLTAAQIETRNGDGVTRAWPLAYPIGKVPTVSPGQCVEAAFSMSALGNAFAYYDLSGVADYVIQSGDQLRYDLQWSADDAYVGFDYTTSDATTLRGAGVVDQNGLSSHAANADLNSRAVGRWYSRRIDLPAGHVGKTIQFYDVCCEWDAGGTKVGRFRNIRITDANGVTRKSIWVGTDAAPATTLHTNSASSTLTSATKVEAAGSVGIRGVEAGKDFYWSKGEPEISRADDAETLLASDVLKVTYQGEYELVAVVEDTAAVVDRQDVEGLGTGLVEDVIEAPNTTGLTAAIEEASGLLARYAKIGRQLSFTTGKAGLRPGHLCTISLPEHGLVNAEMLVERIRVYDAGETGLNYDVTVVEGPILGSWTRLFEQLLERGNARHVDRINIGEKGPLVVVQQVTENWPWEETVTPTVFTPPAPANLKLWLKADALPLAADASVTSWADSAGGAVFTPIASTKPVFRAGQINSLPAVDFENGAGLVGAALSQYITASAFSIFVVLRYFPHTNAASVFDNQAALADAGGFIGLHTTTTNNLHAYSWDGNADSVAKAVARDTWVRARMRHGGGNLYFAINDGSEGSAASGDTTNLTNALRVGRSWNNLGFDGAIAELMVYNADLAAADRSAVESYLATKYAL